MQNVQKKITVSHESHIKQGYNEGENKAFPRYTNIEIIYCCEIYLISNTKGSSSGLKQITKTLI